MATQTHKALFTPVQIGPLSLKHRVVMAPLTRSRSTQPGDIPNALMAEYYGQRASDGGLIITEATTISATARGWFEAPGLTPTSRSKAGKKSSPPSVQNGLNLRRPRLHRLPRLRAARHRIIFLNHTESRFKTQLLTPSRNLSY